MPKTARLDHAALIERSLEGAAERGGDITSLVFERFFALVPQAECLFEQDMHDPQGRGRMLAEMFTILIDQARGEGYVEPTLATIAADHVAYGVEGPELYAAWLEAVGAVVRDLNGPGWSAEMAAAWHSQSGRFLAALGRKRHRAAA